MSSERAIAKYIDRKLSDDDDDDDLEDEKHLARDLGKEALLAALEGYAHGGTVQEGNAMKNSNTDAILDEILGKRGGEVDGADAPPDDAPPDEDPLDVASEELISAVFSKNPQAVSQALRNALELARDDHGEPEHDYGGGCVGGPRVPRPGLKRFR